MDPAAKKLVHCLKERKKERRTFYFSGAHLDATLNDLPSVVLCVEEEVGADDGDADGDDGQDEEHQQHESVDVVDLVGPERGEDEVPENKEIGQKWKLYDSFGF